MQNLLKPMCIAAITVLAGAFAGKTNLFPLPPCNGTLMTQHSGKDVSVPCRFQMATAGACHVSLDGPPYQYTPLLLTPKAPYEHRSAHKMPPADHLQASMNTIADLVGIVVQSCAFVQICE